MSLLLLCQAKCVNQFLFITKVWHWSNNEMELSIVLASTCCRFVDICDNSSNFWVKTVANMFILKDAILWSYLRFKWWSNTIELMSSWLWQTYKLIFGVWKCQNGKRVFRILSDFGSWIFLNAYHTHRGDILKFVNELRLCRLTDLFRNHWETRCKH